MSMSLLQKALESDVVIIALTGPYGDSKFYGKEFVPKKMRDKYDKIPTKDPQEILEWKKDEIERSKYKRCCWRIKLPKDIDQDEPPNPKGMKHVLRAKSFGETIQKSAEELKKKNQTLFVIFVEAYGKPPEGSEPVSTKLKDLQGNEYPLDVEAEASEKGDSIVLDEIELAPESETINFYDYALYDPEKKYPQPRAFHLGRRGYSLSVVQKGDTSGDPYSYSKKDKKYREMKILGVGKLASPWCGKCI